MPFGPIVRSMTQNKTRFMLIILEIAITLAIVTNCVTMILEQRKDMMKQSGFDDDNLLWVRTAPYSAAYKEDKFVEATIDRDVRALRGLPGVVQVANTNFIPWNGGGSSRSVRVEGNDTRYQTQSYYSTPDFLETLGQKLTAGRKFTEADYKYPDTEDAKVTIISRALARLLYGDANPLGKTMMNGDGTSTYTVVGVFEHFYNPYGWPIHEYVAFYPSRVGGYARGLRYLIRVEPGSMKSVVSSIEKRLLSNEPSRIVEMKTIDEIKDTYFAGARLTVKAMTGVIVVLVFVTALGIIGITSLSVAERTKQIGTRRALGATRADIVQHFLLENWIVTTAGLAIGVVAAYGLNFLLVSKVSDVKLDWWLLVAGMAVLWINGIIATLPPALRGTLISPAIATRTV